MIPFMLAVQSLLDGAQAPAPVTEPAAVRSVAQNGVATGGWVSSTLDTGHEVALSGPYGRFSFRPLRTQPVLLLGSGMVDDTMKARLFPRDIYREDFFDSATAPQATMSSAAR